MRKIIVIASIIVAATLGTASPVFAAETLPDAPTTGSIVDNASILTDAEESSINEQITSIEAATGHDVAVLTVLDMGGSSIEDYSIAVARNWELGSAEDNDGVLLVIALQERELRLEVGTGLESVITDSDSSNIIDNIVAPYLSEQDYAGGITAGLAEVNNVLTNDSTAIANTSTDSSDNSSSFGIIIVVCILAVLALIGLVVFIILRIKAKREQAELDAERKLVAQRIATARELTRKRAEEEREMYKQRREEQRQAEIERNRQLQAYYLTPEGKIAKAELDRKEREEQKQQAKIDARNRAVQKEADRQAAETKAETKKFFDGLDPATVRRIKNTSSKNSRQNILKDELEKARDSGTVSRGVDTTSVLNAVLLYSVFTTASSSYGHSDSSSSSYRSSYDSGSSSHSSSYSSSDSGGSFSGGGDSGSF